MTDVDTTQYPVIKAENLKKYYPVSQEGFLKKPLSLKALDGASFTLNKGKTLAVVGESGCGKSTLARLITMIESPTEGNLHIGGINAVGNKKDKKILRRKVQIVFQDPYGSLNPRKKVGTILEEPLKINTDLNASQMREKALHIMDKVGLSKEQYNRYPHMFSGGQRQRIAVARALMLNPDIVVADEPVSALDVSVQAQTLNLLMDLQDEMNLAYLFISHDLSVVRLISDDIMVMYLGRPVEQGDKNVIFEKPLHPYTMALLAATPHVDVKSRQKRIRLSGELPSPLNPPPGCTFHRRCAYMTDICKHKPPHLREVANRMISCHNAEKLINNSH
ncbi:dipeptide transporter; ATP-binding component of ABC superfamily [Desulfamplus magnetovallimortis]|uniref:Dipeptide transporter ATP-binding component of ABC superfamily n=1 Tax=Desulfamplus magnetovallimortis TaxID=1246637 RepID=A0A1W1HGV5_9BACT|nr:dipeptide ABC transporter ATP-binding protein [Desulfamplus magnetovallimortis]SLM31741.1 dipeptide transporter; ATP-binding component of ABC superfamily [Desulfamplus magnetovallimortis]